MVFPSFAGIRPQTNGCTQYLCNGSLTCVDYTNEIHHDTYPAITASKCKQQGRPVLVSGASKGIGTAIAVAFAQAGASAIAIAARSSLDAVEGAVLDAAKATGRAAPKVLKLLLGVSDGENVASVACQIEQSFGHLDIHVNNAGRLEAWHSIGNSDPALWWNTWEVNLKGTYLITRAFLPLLLKGGEKTMININSIGAHLVRPGASAYQTSKLAILRLAEYLVVEYGAQGLLPIAVQPGAVATEMILSALPEKYHWNLTHTPELAADTIVWLTQERKDWLAGRYLSASWDMPEVMARKDEIVQGDKLKVKLVFKPIRSYAGNGYLVPNAGRANLRVLTATIARRVILEKDQHGVLITTGVELQHGGASYSASANREVILSAGSLQSPQLLELSGIGDPKVLEKARIPCVVQIPELGNILQEHVMSAVVYELADGVISLDSIFRGSELLKEHQNLYAENHTGPMSGSVSLMGYISYSSQVSKPGLEGTISNLYYYPIMDERLPPQNDVFQKKQQKVIAARMRSPGSAEIQIVGSPANFDTAKGFSDCTKLMAGAPVGYNACYSIVVSNMYPIFRGNVHVQSSSALDAGLIDSGLPSHQADVNILAAGPDFANRVFQSASLKNKVARRVHPPPEIDLQKKDEARAFIRDHVVTCHYPLGTCAMGQVVDERLRVKGIRHLRVVDASVLPMQISTAIMATVYAIAEKAADMIKKDHRIME